MTDKRLILRIGDAGPPGAPIETVAYPELVIGELDGPVGTAFAILTGDQVYGHSRVLALLNTDVSVKPATLMVSKATAKTRRYCEVLFGSVQFGIANGVLDAVRAGVIPKGRVNELGIIVSVWLDPKAVTSERLDHRALFESNRREMYRALERAMKQEPDIDWLLKNQERIIHEFHERYVSGADL